MLIALKSLGIQYVKLAQAVFNVSRMVTAQQLLYRNALLMLALYVLLMLIALTSSAI